jgi:hypothetical protein
MPESYLDPFTPNDQTCQRGKVTAAVAALSPDELRLLLALYAAAEGEGGWARIDAELLGVER